MAVWDTINVDIDGSGELDTVKVIEKSSAEDARRNGYEELQGIYHAHVLTGKHKGKRAIIIKKNGEYSVFKLFLVILIGICLNLLDMDTIRSNTRYVRTKPRIENLSA